jgi:hypothetical protein
MWMRKGNFWPPESLLSLKWKPCVMKSTNLVNTAEPNTQVTECKVSCYDYKQTWREVVMTYSEVLPSTCMDYQHHPVYIIRVYFSKIRFTISLYSHPSLVALTDVLQPKHCMHFIPPACSMFCYGLIWDRRSNGCQIVDINCALKQDSVCKEYEGTGKIQNIT